MNISDRLKNLVNETLYEVADFSLDIPDVDQMAESLYFQLTDFVQIQPTLYDFKRDFLEYFVAFDRLNGALFAGVVEDLLGILGTNPNIKICFWTQGNIFVQTAKANCIKSKIPAQYLANLSIYASLRKLPILPYVVNNLQEEGCTKFYLLDDRLENVYGAHDFFKANLSLEEFVVFQKIRPDRETPKQLISAECSSHLSKITDWLDIVPFLEQDGADVMRAIILDLDGVIFNSTVFRKELESDLFEFLQGLV